VTDKILRIDVHQHVVFDEYRSALESAGLAGSGERGWPDWSADQTLAMMERVGIDAAVVSIASPGTYFNDIGFTKRLVRDCNDAFARFVGDHPGKFAALGLVSLPDVSLAAADVEYALDTLRLDGIGLVSHYGDKYLGDPDFSEFYAELDRRNAVVFIHPVRAPYARDLGVHYPVGITELVFDSTRAVTNMLATGVFERYPNIRWIIPHAGGVVPFLLYRICKLDRMPAHRDMVPKGVRTYLKRLYYDVAQSIDPPALRALMEMADPAHVMFGTDYPFARNPEAVVRDTIAGVNTFEGFDDSLRTSIDRDNALALFPRFAG